MWTTAPPSTLLCLQHLRYITPGYPRNRVWTSFPIHRCSLKKIGHLPTFHRNVGKMFAVSGSPFPPSLFVRGSAAGRVENVISTPSTDCGRDDRLLTALRWVPLPEWRAIFRAAIHFPAPHRSTPT